MKTLKSHFSIRTNFLTMIILLLQNLFYTYEYMDYWKKFNETSLTEKQDVYSHLNTENITDADCTYAKSSL